MLGITADDVELLDDLTLRSDRVDVSEEVESTLERLESLVRVKGESIALSLLTGFLFIFDPIDPLAVVVVVSLPSLFPWLGPADKT